ncbi:uncharacterized protein LOC135344450 [Halichondria panicea]|uniref:uncharacterized protein LOC135344450 n=1 Tax=Halichondria panicea TaxID=6063 RepID=UPI00312B3523
METYICTVVGGVITVWSGTAFDCPANNVILVHSQYSGGTAVGTCTSGAIIGNGTSVDTSGAEPCYTSELSVTISANMDGQTVMCSRDDSTVIGSHSLQVAGPPPPPTNVMVTAVDVATFSVTWMDLTSGCRTSSSYDIISDCGGSCSVSTNMLGGVCSGLTAPQSCSVMVRANSILCGGQTGSFNTIMLNLMEPSPPPAGDVSVLAVYSDDSLDSIIVTFPVVTPVVVAPGLSPAVTYSVQTVGDPQVVLMSDCNATLCQYQTNFISDNRPSNPFTVTVTVSNGIGGGQSVNTPFQVPVSISSLVTLTVVVKDSNATVSARLSSGFQGSTGLTVTYGIMSNCDANTVISANGTAGDTLEVILTSLQPYCYSIYFNQGVLSFKVTGVLRSECDVAELSEGPIEPSEMCLMDGFVGGIIISNGRVCYNGTTPGAQNFAIPFCNKGTHLLSGDSSPYRECLSNGEWSGTVAQCEPFIPTLSPEAAIALTFALTFLLTLVLGVSIGTISALAINKCRRNQKINLETETEIRPPVVAIYEEPDSIKPEPHTQGNLAYGHVQF